MPFGFVSVHSVVIAFGLQETTEFTDRRHRNEASFETNDYKFKRLL